MVWILEFWFRFYFLWSPQLLKKLVPRFVIQPSYCLLYLCSWMLTSTQKVSGSMRPYSTKPEIIWGVVYWWWPPIFKFQLVSHPGSHTCEAWWKHLWSNLATAFLQRKKSTVACDHTPPNLKLFEGGLLVVAPHLQISTCIAPRVPHLWSLVKAFVIQPSYCLLYLSSWMLTSTQKVNSSMRS